MNSGFPQKQETSEKLKAKQYGAAALILILAAIIMTVIRLLWGSVMLGSGSDVPLGMVVFYVRSLVLLFGAIDLFSAGYHFVLWNRNGRPCMDDDNNSLFSDWKSGERSPIKVSLIMMAGITVLAILMVLQG